MRLARRGSRSGRVDELDTRSKREKKAKEKAKPGTRLASKLSLVRIAGLEFAIHHFTAWNEMKKRLFYAVF